MKPTTLERAVLFRNWLSNRKIHESETTRTISGSELKEEIKNRKEGDAA